MDSSPIISGSLSIGVTTFGPITPAVGVTTVQVAVDRTTLSLATKPIDMALELSIDSGLTWTPYGGCTAPPGTAMTGGGMGTISNTVLTESVMEVKIPPADSKTRLRGSVTTQEIVPTTITLRTS